MGWHTYALPTVYLIMTIAYITDSLLASSFEVGNNNERWDNNLEEGLNPMTRERRQTSTKFINIGLILSPQNARVDDKESPFEILLREQLARNNSKNIAEGNSLQFRLISASIVSNPIEMSKLVCNELIGSKYGGVSAVIVDTDSKYTASIASVSFTLGLYNIPVIGTTLRDSSLFNKNLHSSYISLIPPYSHQADVWYNLMIELHFEKAFILTSSENRDLLSRLVDLVDRNRVNHIEMKIEDIIEYDNLNQDSERRFVIERLSNVLENSICRVFLIHAQTLDDIKYSIEILESLNMTSLGFSLIFSEEALQMAILHNISLPSGLLSSQLSSTSQRLSDSKVFALDALDLVVRSIQDINYGDEPFNDVPKSCNSTPLADWSTGIELYMTILQQSFKGITSYISFDESGDRLTATYDIMNLVEDIDKDGKRKQVLRTIGRFENGLKSVIEQAANESLMATTSTRINVTTLQWPGGIEGQLISGVYVNKHLRLVTLQEKPFVWVLGKEECELAKAKNENRTRIAFIPCYNINSDKSSREEHCCVGYCMDLLDQISRRLNFTYDLFLVPDNQYGSLEFRSTSNYSGESRKDPDWRLEDVDAGRQSLIQADGNPNARWTGLMGELVSKRADMAFAPLTITPQRAQAIDFSKPFKFHGFSILLRRASKHTTLASFLQPFHNQLWILVIGVATHVVALTLYLLDRYSTFGRYGIKHHFIPATNEDQLQSSEDKPLHLSSSIWFSWSILLNSGVGEHTPKSLSGRVLGIVWSGFAMIVVASYTANLAAFLVLDSREETPTLSGIDDPRLRSGDLAFNFATVKGSAVDAYLQSQVEYINLYRKMEEFNFANVDESILALRSGLIDALIWDSTRLEWEVAHDEKCSLGIAGELFGSSGYGIGLQQDSYWTKNITTELLELHESGFMVELDKKWVGVGKSQQQSQLFAGSFGLQAGNCERRTEDNPETLGIFNIAGVFILFACGLLASFPLILIERFCYKNQLALRIFARNCLRPTSQPTNQVN